MSAGLAINVFACCAATFLGVVAGVLLCQNGRLTERVRNLSDENKAVYAMALAADWDRGAAQGELQAFLDRQVDHLVDDALDGDA